MEGTQERVDREKQEGAVRELQKWDRQSWGRASRAQFWGNA
jgi:hypothetical protein